MPLLVSRARDDAQACKELIDALIAMRAPGDEADEARVVVAQLDAKSLDGLVDETGRDAKTEAVETLLSLGFPHALNVSPEDLDYLRGAAPPGALGDLVQRIHRSRQRMLAVAVVGPLLTAGPAIVNLEKEPQLALLATVSGLLAFVGAAWLRTLPPRLQGQGGAVTLTVLGVLASGALGVTMGPLGIAGAVAMGLGLYGLLGWQLL